MIMTLKTLCRIVARSVGTHLIRYGSLSFLDLPGGGAERDGPFFPAVYAYPSPCSSGEASFSTVGLPDAAVRESRERLRAAMRNCGYDLPVAESRLITTRATAHPGAPALQGPRRFV